MTKATHRKVADRLVKAADDLKELGHPALAMRVAALLGEVRRAEKTKKYQEHLDSIFHDLR